jgi:competence protein ComEC
LRAAIMVCLYLCADLLEREPDTPSALSVAGIIFLLWDPHSAFDLGFQLSFASVASILIFTSVLEEKLTRLHRYFRAPLAVSLSVQILPLPIAAANFHALPVAAPLANLAAIPILGAVLWLCFATSLLSFVWVPAAQIAGYAAWLPIAALREVAYAGSSLRPLSLALTTPTTTAWALYWSAAALLIASTMVVPRRRKAVLAVALAVFIASAVLWRNRAHEPEVVMLDVGHGDATFIRWPGGETLLIDGGDASEYVDRGRQIVAPFLWARGYTRLDAVMASHADRDHLGGLIYVVDNFRVGTAILGAAESGQPLEHAFVAHCESRGTRILRVKRGQTVAIGGVEIEIQHPTADLPAGTPVNNLSIVARAPFGPKSFLFTGDIEHEIEAVLDPSALPADVLKVPHHGADTSSTLPFVRAVAPAYATISTGSHGRRVMDWPIVQRYRAENIVVLRTDRHGAIRFTLRGGELEVESEREKRGYPIAIE